MTGNGRIDRLRRWLLALTIVVIAGAVAAPIIGSAILNAREAETQLVVSCTSARANVAQLTALREISDQLGVPTNFAIPEVPPECDGH
jgi:type II secretory pathway pseudopilin PulG